MATTTPRRAVGSFWAALAVAFLSLGLIAAPAAAIDPEEQLADPAQEERARQIIKHLRCVVCDNASVEDSNAQIAKNMRMLVRERVQQGRSADEIFVEFEAYYGEYVRLQPKFTLSNAFIWAAAPLALLIGLFWISRRLKAGPEPAAAVAAGAPPDDEPTPAPLTEEERRRLRELLKD